MGRNNYWGEHMKYISAFILGKLSLLAISLGVASSMVFADNEPDYIEEITVTAEKTESSLQSTAISITVSYTHLTLPTICSV